MSMTLVLILGAVFLYLKIKHPATIWLGIIFISFVLAFSFLILSLFIENGYLIFWQNLFSYFGDLFFVVVLFIIGLFIITGVKMIWREGFEFENTLSLLMGVGSLLYFILLPIVFDLTDSNWMNTFYQFFNSVVIYLGLILFLFTLSSVLNLIHFNRTSIDYFIVLGAALDGAEVSPILASRIDKGTELQEKQQTGKLLFTGGQGPDECISEGQAMAEYASDHGVSSDLILKETKSTSTEENIRLSKAIIDADWNESRSPVLAIVTNNYHILRALMTAKEQGITAIGYGSSSKFYYSLNAFLREYVAYLRMTYKVQLIMVFLLGIGHLVFV